MKKAFSINSKSLRLVINNNLLNNNKILDNFSNTLSEKICKWDYQNVSIDNFLNVTSERKRDTLAGSHGVMCAQSTSSALLS